MKFADRHRFSEHGQSIGWISTSDLLLVTSAAVLAAAGFLSTRLTEARADLVSTRTERTDLLKHAEELTSKTEKLQGQVDSLESELQGAKSELQVAEQQRKAALEEAGQSKLELADLRTKWNALEEQLQTLDNLKKKLKESTALLDAKDAELSAVYGEQARLRKEKEALTKEVTQLKREARDAQALADANRRLTEEKQQIAVQLAETEEARRRLQAKLGDIEAQVMEPLRTARLEVRIFSNEIPEGFDLNLFMQDPNDQVGSWLEPRIWSEDRNANKFEQTGMFILSKDLRRTKGTSEEIFYSTRLFSHASYQVFGMIRKTRPEIRDGPDVAVNYEIKVDGKAKQSGSTPVPCAGAVQKTSSGYLFNALYPITAFSVDSRGSVTRAKVEPRLRGSQAETNMDPSAKTVTGIRD